MRVVQIGATLVGAQEKIEIAIHRYLKAHGHESYILYAIGSSKDPDVIRYESWFDELIRRGMRKVFGKDHRFAQRSTRHLLRELDKLSPDVVHIHTIHHGYLDFERLFTYLAKKEVLVVYTLHDMWPFTGGCYHYTRVKCDRYLTGCKDCPQRTTALDCERHRTAALWEKKQQLFQAQKQIWFTAVSPWVRTEAARSAIGAYPLYTVRNAVEPTEINREDAAGQTDGKVTVIGVATSWSEEKGIQLFLELAELLSEEARIVLVGAADEKIRSSAPANVVFAGSVADKKKLAGLYAAADVHVSMSLEETFGMTFVEAALVGTRSIGFNGTAVPQIVESVCGDVVNEFTAQAVADRIRRRSADRESWKLSADEMASIRQRYSVQRMAQNYLKIYEAILQK